METACSSQYTGRCPGERKAESSLDAAALSPGRRDLTTRRGRGDRKGAAEMRSRFTPGPLQQRSMQGGNFGPAACQPT
ncbi:hypothetical protein GQ55_5G060600 [Panicum hallii var. hallii]|uniref:Uncharacterized protein n=1 Tax=Panicum hallii var. hallii TaxID=1504633 RepID=A0A2T7DDB1_9POAL|nr:hypothetical protein GQ55_5G060600 [Panicum hallii var. hallii]